MEKTRQFLLTVAAGKRLIARSLLHIEVLQTALKEHTVVIIAGSTNGYVAEEILSSLELGADFEKSSFLRGVNLGPGSKIAKGPFTNTDIVIEKGRWLRGRTIFDTASSLKAGDVILKGANAVQADRKMAGIQIGHPEMGTSTPILSAVLGRHTALIIPVGLEKRIWGTVTDAAARANALSSSGPRLLPVTGLIVTELEALQMISGVTASLIAAGGILGGEGSYWIEVTGTQEQVARAAEVIRSVQAEPAF